MLLDRKEFRNEKDELAAVESLFDSSNVSKTLFYPLRNLMFIFFGNGLVYSYSNITNELYENLEKAESQGKFFISEIKKKPQEYRYLREYKLREFEKSDLNETITLLKEQKKNL